MWSVRHTQPARSLTALKWRISCWWGVVYQRQCSSNLARHSTLMSSPLNFQKYHVHKHILITHVHYRSILTIGVFIIIIITDTFLMFFRSNCFHVSGLYICRKPTSVLPLRHSHKENQHGSRPASCVECRLRPTNDLLEEANFSHGFVACY